MRPVLEMNNRRSLAAKPKSAFGVPVQLRMLTLLPGAPVRLANRRLLPLAVAPVEKSMVEFALSVSAPMAALDPEAPPAGPSLTPPVLRVPPARFTVAEFLIRSVVAALLSNN